MEKKKIAKATAPLLIHMSHTHTHARRQIQRLAHVSLKQRAHMAFSDGGSLRSAHTIHQHTQDVVICVLLASHRWCVLHHARFKTYTTLVSRTRSADNTRTQAHTHTVRRTQAYAGIGKHCMAFTTKQ